MAPTEASSRIVTFALPAAVGTSERCTVAVAQYEMRGGRNADEISDEIARLARPAAAEGARLCVFPELIALDAMSVAAKREEEERIVREIAGELMPRLVAGATALARELGLAILLGGPRLQGDAVRNTEYLLFADGRRVEQDKLFPTRWERDMGWEAGEELLVFDAPWGRSAVATCYDVEFPCISQALASHDIEVLLVPSMTESHQGACRVRDAARTRASEHCAYVAVACTTGDPAPDWQHFGRGAVIASQEGPFHGLEAEVPEAGPGLVLVELDLGLLRKTRAGVAHFPVRDELARKRPVQIRMIDS